MLHIGRWLCGSDAVAVLAPASKAAGTRLRSLQCQPAERRRALAPDAEVNEVHHAARRPQAVDAADYQPQARASAPLGMCSTWFDGARAYSQPAPTDCASALRPSRCLTRDVTFGSRVTGGHCHATPHPIWLGPINRKGRPDRKKPPKPDAH